LVLTIRSLLRTLRTSVVATLPLVAEQPVTFQAAGPYELYGEGSFGSSVFAGLDFELNDAEGRVVPMHRVLFRTVVRSFSGVRLQLRTFTIPRDGTFTLRVLGAAHATERERLIIGIPARARIIAHVLALVMLGIITIGSLVATILLIVQPTLQH